MICVQIRPSLMRQSRGPRTASATLRRRHLHTLTELTFFMILLVMIMYVLVTV